MHTFVAELAGLRLDRCFNPYADRCPLHDAPDAPVLRASLLSAIVAQAELGGVDALWIGRDLGHRGGRRTGLALTDDVHLAHHAARWQAHAIRATVTTPVAERTAAVVWGMLTRIEARIFLWNVFPLHPHEVDMPLTNRQHTRRERDYGEGVLEALIRLLRPKTLVAIGNDAAASVVRVGNSASVQRVRHPSYGGQRDFTQQLALIYNLKPDRPLLL